MAGRAADGLTVTEPGPKPDNVTPADPVAFCSRVSATPASGARSSAAGWSPPGASPGSDAAPADRPSAVTSARRAGRRDGSPFNVAARQVRKVAVHPCSSPCVSYRARLLASSAADSQHRGPGGLPGFRGPVTLPLAPAGRAPRPAKREFGWAVPSQRRERPLSGPLNLNRKFSRRGRSVSTRWMPPTNHQTHSIGVRCVALRGAGHADAG